MFALFDIDPIQFNYSTYLLLAERIKFVIIKKKTRICVTVPNKLKKDILKNKKIYV